MKLFIVRRFLLGFLAVGAVAALVACGGDDKEDEVANSEFASRCQKTSEKQFTQPEQVIDSDKSYTATIKTEKGDITLELYPAKAPVTVNSFVFLACSGYFDNITWHRVLPGFVAQTGDPTASGSGGPGYEIPDEIADLKFEKGSVGMANAGPNTNGSQFFICYEPQPDLEGSYTVFGKVTEGFDILEKLTPRDPRANPNAPAGDKLLEIKITEQ